jgi:hypothetical protein
MSIEIYSNTTTDTISQLKEQFKSLVSGGFEDLGKTVLIGNKEETNPNFSKEIELNEERLSPGIISQIQQLRDGFTNTFDGGEIVSKNNIVPFSKKKVANISKN